jgi:hypothetical protein
MAASALVIFIHLPDATLRVNASNGGKAACCRMRNKRET